MSPFLFGCQFMLVNLLIYSNKLNHARLLAKNLKKKKKTLLTKIC